MHIDVVVSAEMPADLFVIGQDKLRIIFGEYF